MKQKNDTIHHAKAVSNWLFVVCFLIFLIVIVGGTTRLTRSGLSMVDWKPVTGIVPPIGDSEWQIEFERYKLFPEYKKINKGMNLNEFKAIFFWEYFHRLLGRIIGLAFLIPFIVFWTRGYLVQMNKTPFIIMFCLGGLQGLLGWYMVKSGLVNMPQVSHYRLASHLLLAFLVYSYIFYQAVKIRRTSRLDKTGYNFISLLEPGKRLWFLSLIILISQIFFGALVAGLKAGYLANTFPLINGVWLPDGLFSYDPAWLSIVELPLTVQFVHRILGWVLIVIIPLLVLNLWRILPESRIILTGLLLGIGIQFLLGVLTLLFYVPVFLGVLHQAGALILLSIFWLILYDLNHLNHLENQDPAPDIKKL